MKVKFLCLLLFSCFLSCRDSLQNDRPAREPVSVRTHVSEPEEDEIAPDSIRVIPVHKASFVMELGGRVIYVDPLSGAADYQHFPIPDLVLLTFDNPKRVLSETVRRWADKQAVLIVPESAHLTLSRKLAKQTVIMKNDRDTTLMGIDIRTLAGPKSTGMNSKGLPATTRNSYLLAGDNKRVYISGFTRNSDELRTLEDIDLAFVRMDLPDFETLKEMTDIVLAAKPKKVYPYNYRGVYMYSKLALFKKRVETRDPDIAVQILNWYPAEEVGVKKWTSEGVNKLRGSQLPPIN